MCQQNDIPKPKKISDEFFLAIKYFISPSADKTMLSTITTRYLLSVNKELLKLQHTEDKKWGYEEISINIVNADKSENRLYLLQRKWTQAEKTKEGEVKAARSKPVYWAIKFNEGLKKSKSLKLQYIVESIVNGSAKHIRVEDHDPNPIRK